MAFVDILAGALGAVILLFVIVPKMDSSSVAALEKVEVLERHSISLDSIIEDIAYLIPREKADKLRRVNDSIKNQTQELKLHVEELTTRNNSLSKEVEELKTELNRSQWKADYLEKRLKKFEKIDAIKITQQLEDKEKLLEEKKETLAQKEREIQEAKQTVHELTDSIQNDLVKKTNTLEKGETMWLMGMNPDLAVILEWEDEKADVDLYLEKDGKFCDEENRKTKFGQWIKLPRKMRVGNSEFIVQKNLVPGNYNIYAHVYRPKKGASVKISGKAYLHPDRTKYNKADFGSFTISNTRPPYKNDGGTKLGELIVNENSIYFNSNQNIVNN